MSATTMSTPALRLFAMFWWLLVVVSGGIGIGGSMIAWEAYHSSREYTAYQAALGAREAALAKLPMGTLAPGPAPAVPQSSNVFVPDADQPLLHPDPTIYVVGAAAALLVSVLPFVILTLVRWIITARWHLGPRW